MITNLQYLRIYEDAINDAIGMSERAVERYAPSRADELFDSAMEAMKEIGTFDNITNSIIMSFFYAADQIIAQECPSVETDYYVNCHDSHFYVDHEPV